MQSVVIKWTRLKDIPSPIPGKGVRYEEHGASPKEIRYHFR